MGIRRTNKVISPCGRPSRYGVPLQQAQGNPPGITPEQYQVGIHTEVYHGLQEPLAEQVAGFSNGSRTACGHHREFERREKAGCLRRLRLHTPHHMQIAWLIFVGTVYTGKNPEQIMQKGRTRTPGGNGENKLFFSNLLNERLLNTHCQKL